MSHAEPSNRNRSSSNSSDGSRAIPSRGWRWARRAFVAVTVLVATAAYFLFARGRELPGKSARDLVARGALLLDVRSVAEFGAGHLPGAVNVPVQELAGRLDELGARDREMVIYCRSGHRSTQATELLRARGFTRVHNLGPMTAW